MAFLGGVLAAAFRPSVFPLIAANSLAMCLVVGGALYFSLAVALLLARVAHLDGKTAALVTLLGAAPGRTATWLIRTGTQWTKRCPQIIENRINKRITGRTRMG